MSTERMNEGACRNHDPELWWPIGEGPASAPDIAKAKAICNDCPIMRRCLAYAVERTEPGIWGGTTENERKTIRRRWRQSTEPDPNGPRKECSRCREPKLLVEFPRRTRSADGLDAQCRACKSEAYREYTESKKAVSA